VAWTSDDRFDESAYRADVARCCRAGIPGVYTGGTTGEFYAMDLDEYREVARATVEECHAHDTPAMIGCSATYTLGAIRRAQIAVEIGGDAIQLALPFWLEVSARDVVPFFKSVADAADGLPLSIYDTARCKRRLTLDQHLAIKDAIPNYVMVKATAGTIGATPEGCRALSERINVFVGETHWTELGRCGARGGCSSMVYWNPQFTLDFWSKVESGDWDAVDANHQKVAGLFEFLFRQFESRGLTDTAYDRLGGIACGFLKTSLRSRGPYPSVSSEDVETFRTWCKCNFPEILTTDTNAASYGTTT